MSFYAKYLPHNKIYLINQQIYNRSSRYFTAEFITPELTCLEFYFGSPDWYVLTEKEVKIHKLEQL